MHSPFFVNEHVSCYASSQYVEVCRQAKLPYPVPVLLGIFFKYFSSGKLLYLLIFARNICNFSLLDCPYYWMLCQCCCKSLIIADKTSKAHETARRAGDQKGSMHTSCGQ